VPIKKLIVIDSFGIFFRSFYAMPQFQNSKGVPTGMITGFINFIYQLGKEINGDYYIFALDSKGDTFRNEIYPEYKANRKESPPELKIQLKIVIKLLAKMGFKTVAIDGYEADDIITSIVEDAQNYNIETVVVSSDKDLYQLLNKCEIYDPMKKIKVSKKNCIEKFGVPVESFIDYQSLVGDSSDNIKGVKGIGAKSAQKLIAEFKTLDNIYANIENIESKRYQTLLKNGRESALLSRELVTLKDDIYKIENLESCIYPIENPILKIESDLLELEIEQILDRVKNYGLSVKTVIPKKIEFKNILILDFDELIKILDSIPKSQDTIIAFDVETTSLDIYNAKIVGFSFSFDNPNNHNNYSFYVPLQHYYLGVPKQIDLESAKIAIKQLFQFKIVGQNIKFDLQILKYALNLDLKPYCDTMILSWLIDPERFHSLDKMAKRELNYDMISFDEVVSKGETFASLDIIKASEYAGEDAYITLLLYKKLIQDLEKIDKKLLKILFQLEMPFIEILINMADNGILIDKNYIENFKKDLDSKLNKNQNIIFDLAGYSFNLNSPKQLSELLFNRLNLTTKRKNKRGFSTDEKVLKQLLNEHSIIPYILEYRELFKLNSTYVNPLLNIKTSRVYTNFLHTGTATGRLSSQNPNLQNIPIKTEIGNRVRKGFIAKDGFKLLSVDYSQIELRLLAHFSQDKKLVEAFNSGRDIHSEVALNLFQSKEKKYRNIAKTINYGLIYGMGSRKLSQNLDISIDEAKNYIKLYFENFSSIESYINTIENSVVKKGYVSTLIGRRRYFNFRNLSAEHIIRAYQREAVNTIFQASAADIIKLAMKKVFLKIKDRDDIFLLLQIHDELIFEVKNDIVEIFKDELKDIMENIYTLTIPLKVNISIGNSWGDLK